MNLLQTITFHFLYFVSTFTEKKIVSISHCEYPYHIVDSVHCDSKQGKQLKKYEQTTRPHK